MRRNNSEIRFATFNVCNLAPVGLRYYERIEPYTQEEYDAKVNWIAHQLDMMNADLVGVQEVFVMSALQDALSRTKYYKDAKLIGFNPDLSLDRKTPHVALVSRLPVIGEAKQYPDLPPDLHITLPSSNRTMSRFTRPVLQVRVMLPNDTPINVFVTHLKSKNPDYMSGEREENSRDFGMAALRSMVRRGNEALALRLLIAENLEKTREPAVLLGDFNNTITSTPLKIIMGSETSNHGNFDERLFDSAYIAQYQGRDVSYTTIFDGRYETLDHILVSEEFNPDSRYAIGEVVEMYYFNDHITLEMPEASDHGQVMARIRLY